MGSPLEVFRHPHAVRVLTPSTLVKGVMVPGAPLYATITASVQRIGRTQAELLTKQGKRISDYRRIYTDTKLPLSDEVAGTPAQGIPEESDLIQDVTGYIIPFTKGKGIAGQVDIGGVWYEVAERHPMQNGVINHYQYLLFRVLENDQTL